jgi:hypothetical protein
MPAISFGLGFLRQKVGEDCVKLDSYDSCVGKTARGQKPRALTVQLSAQSTKSNTQAAVALLYVQ